MAGSFLRWSLPAMLPLLWSLAASAQPLPKPEPRRPTLVFSADAKLLAVVEGKAIRVLDSASGKVLATLAHEEDVDCVIFSADGKTAISSAWPVSLCFWEMPSGKKVKEIDLALTSLAASPDGKVIAAGHHNFLRLLDAKTGRILRQIEGRATSAGNLAFSPCGKRLAGSSDDTPYALGIWDLGKQATFRLLDESRDFVFQAAFSPDGRLCGAMTADGRAAVWELLSGRKVLDETGPWLHPLTFVDNRTIVYADGAGFHWRDLFSGEEVQRVRFDLGVQKGAGVGMAPGGRRLAIATADKKVRFIDGPEKSPAKPIVLRRNLESLWKELASPKATVGWRAMWEMSRSKDAVAFLTERIKPYALTAAQVKELIRDLDSPRYALREQASHELLESFARPYLRAVLAENRGLEFAARVERLLQRLDAGELCPKLLQQLRAIGVLEKQGTPEARALLRRLANAEPANHWTREAAATLEYFERTAKRDKP